MDDRKPAGCPVEVAPIVCMYEDVRSSRSRSSASSCSTETRGATFGSGFFLTCLSIADEKKPPSVLSRRPGTEPHEEETPPTLDDTLVWGKDPLRLSAAKLGK